MALLEQIEQNSEKALAGYDKFLGFASTRRADTHIVDAIIKGRRGNCELASAAFQSICLVH